MQICYCCKFGLTIFPVLYMTSPWSIYFIARSLYLSFCCLAFIITTSMYLLHLHLDIVAWILQCHSLDLKESPYLLEGQDIRARARIGFMQFLALATKITGSVQFSHSAMSTLCNPMDYSTPGLLVHHQLPELAQTHIHRVGNAIQPSHPLSFSSPAAFKLCQQQGLFQWVSSLHQVAKVFGFSFSTSPSNQYWGLISFRIDCFDFLAVQRTLKSLLQHHSSKASMHRRSAFFMVQLSHPYMTTGKTIALTRRAFVAK